MLSFLRKCDISIDVIKMIERENSSANIYNLDCNDKEVCKIIEYLNGLNITCINELLIYKIDLFFGSLDDLKKKFSKYETNSLVQALNNDYNIINEL